MSYQDKFKQAFDSKIQKASQAQLRWVKATTINWDEKTMDAMGIADELEYYGIQLGAGSIFLKPKPDAICLIGILEGQEAAGFLLSASEVEEITVEAKTLINLNGGTLGGLVKVSETVERLNVLEKDLNDLKKTLSGWTPIPNDGGAALKTALSSYAAASITVTKETDIHNEKVKQ